MVSRNKTGPILKLKLCNSVNKLLFAQETFLRSRFARDFSSWISLGKIQSLLKGCPNITGVDNKAWLQKLVSANQFIYSNLWNKFVANKSWFTASWSPVPVIGFPATLNTQFFYELFFLISIDSEGTARSGR